MTSATVVRSVFALLVIVLGNLQAWDSGVHQAGLWIVLLVSLGTTIPALALLLPLQRPSLLAAFGISLLLLTAARFTAPVPLSGIYLILVPAVMALIFTGLVDGNRNA